MRVIFDGIVYSSAPTGGTYQLFNQIIPRIAKLPDTEVRIWLPKVSAPPPAAENVVVARNVLPSFRFIPPGKLRQSLGSVKRVLEANLQRFKIRGMGKAVFHSTGMTLSPWKDIPQILTVHDMISEMLQGDLDLQHIVDMRNQKKVAIETSQRFIAISQTTKRDLCRIYSVDPSSVDVIYHGVDHKFFGNPRSELEKARVRQLFGLSKPFVLYVGGRLHHKNFPRFLEAYASSKIRNDYDLGVAGFDWTDEELQLIEKLKVGKHIRHMKYELVSDALPALYQMASVFVFPSLYEGFGLPLIEAFAAGCPVAAANAGPLPEIGGDAALFFDPKDIGDIAKKMEALLDPKLAEEYRRKGRAKAQEYDWDKTARLTLETYKRALS